jgi:hypothetical protein
MRSGVLQEDGAEISPTTQSHLTDKITPLVLNGEVARYSRFTPSSLLMGFDIKKAPMDR